MPSQSQKQHNYMKYVAYGKPDATAEERKMAKEFLAADEANGRYQGGHAGIICAIIKQGDKFVLMWHNKKACWTFPTGKIEPEESDEEALIREMKEELDISVTGTTLLGNVTLTTDMKTPLRFEVFRVNQFHGSIKNKEPHKHARIKLCTKVELKSLSELDTTSDLIRLVLDKGWV